MFAGEMDDVLDCVCSVFIHRSVCWHPDIMASDCSTWSL